MPRTIDFDAYRAERKTEEITLVIGGESYGLSAEMPAEVALEAIALRNEMGEDAEIPAEKIGDLAKALFGADLLETLVSKHRLTTSELATLIVEVFGQYSGTLVPNPTARVSRATRRRKQGSSSA